MSQQSRPDPPFFRRHALDDLDPGLPPRYAFAGARHLVLSVATRERLAELHYDFDRLRSLLESRECVTLALIHRRASTIFDVRNAFPTGGVVEDPATGAAAAALGGYLRALTIAEPPASIRIHQGADMGRPSQISVDIPPGEGGIDVSGAAVLLT